MLANVKLGVCRKGFKYLSGISHCGVEVTGRIVLSVSLMYRRSKAMLLSLVDVVFNPSLICLSCLSFVLWYAK